MPPPQEPQSAVKKAEHALGQLLVLFSASMLLVFVLQIPPSQAQQGSGNKMCDGTKDQYKCPFGLKAKQCEKKYKVKKDGRLYKPCQEACGASGGIAKGSCVAPQKCLTTSTCQGKKPKKPDPKDMKPPPSPKGGPVKKADPMSGEKKDEKGGEMPKLPDMKPPEKKPKEPPPKQEPQNQQPCQKDQYGNVKFPATPPGCNPNPVQ